MRNKQPMLNNKTAIVLLVAMIAGLLAGCATAPPPPPPMPETKPEPPPAPPAPPVPPPAAKESVTLLPQPDGQPSAVVVSSAGKEMVLDRPYMVATIDAGNIISGVTTAEKVQAEFSELLAADPPGPKKFLLFYESGDILLTAESKKLFEQVKAELQHYPAGEVVLIAHTDRVGSEKSNDKLSLRRAEAVKVLLVLIGIPESIIQVSGRGEREPLVPTQDGVAEAQNRRVEIKVR